MKQINIEPNYRVINEIIYSDANAILVKNYRDEVCNFATKNDLY